MNKILALLYTARCRKVAGSVSPTGSAPTILLPHLHAPLTPSALSANLHSTGVPAPAPRVQGMEMGNGQSTCACAMALSTSRAQGKMPGNVAYN